MSFLFFFFLFYKWPQKHFETIYKSIKNCSLELFIFIVIDFTTALISSRADRKTPTLDENEEKKKRDWERDRHD